MKRVRINFSSKPFYVKSPALIGFWITNAALLLLLGFTIWKFTSLRNANQNLHASLTNIAQEDQSAMADIQRLSSELDQIQVRDFERQVDQFYAMQRAFDPAWGLLLDTIAKTINNDVRLIQLQSNELPSNKQEAWSFVLTAEARSKEAELEFVQQLQKTRGFEKVRFESEEYRQNMVRFECSFLFHLEGQRGQ